MNASKSLANLLADAQQGGKVKQLRNAEFQAVVAELSDKKYLDAIYWQQDVSRLMDICGKSNEAVVSISLFDLKSAMHSKSTKEDVQAAVVQISTKNTVEFQGELTMLQPFLIACMAKAMPLMAEFFVSLPSDQMTDVRRAGLIQMRGGLLSVYFSALQAASQTQLRQSYRLALMQSLAENSAAYAATMQLAVRKSIVDAVQSVRPVAPPEFSAYLNTISKEMSIKKCDGLCAFN